MTGLFLVSLVVVFVTLASASQARREEGRWKIGYTDQMNAYLADPNTTAEAAAGIIAPEKINVTRSVREGYEPIEGVVTLADLLTEKSANLHYDLTGEKAPLGNTVFLADQSGEWHKVSVWRLTEWPTSPTMMAQIAQNIQAGVALVFVLFLTAAIFTTVGVSVYQKKSAKAVTHGS
ncbi:hypothetical protein [Mycoplasma sp. ATU-Cv-508]|uniref:hypothetical protein n=1 Tax=Mycoplasma sp. ATU-Cv-508 TaxID=2048001 RepID=UPI000FDF06B9